MNGRIRAAYNASCSGLTLDCEFAVQVITGSKLLDENYPQVLLV